MRTGSASGAAPPHRLEDADYRGYGIRPGAEPDEELTRIGPGTRCGEYLRRFWHPVALSSAVAG